MVNGWHPLENKLRRKLKNKLRKKLRHPLSSSTLQSNNGSQQRKWSSSTRNNAFLISSISPISPQNSVTCNGQYRRHLINAQPMSIPKMATGKHMLSMLTNGAIRYRPTWKDFVVICERLFRNEPFRELKMSIEIRITWFREDLTIQSNQKLPCEHLVSPRRNQLLAG